jgi:hypothetical protein
LSFGTFDSPSTPGIANMPANLYPFFVSHHRGAPHPCYQGIGVGDRFAPDCVVSHGVGLNGGIFGYRRVCWSHGSRRLRHDSGDRPRRDDRRHALLYQCGTGGQASASPRRASGLRCVLRGPARATMVVNPAYEKRGAQEQIRRAFTMPMGGAVVNCGEGVVARVRPPARPCFHSLTGRQGAGDRRGLRGVTGRRRRAMALPDSSSKLAKIHPHDRAMRPPFGRLSRSGNGPWGKNRCEPLRRSSRTEKHSGNSVPAAP